MLPILFFSIATIYASVGFGGGTSYLALLTIFDKSISLSELKKFV